MFLNAPCDARQTSAPPLEEPSPNQNPHSRPVCCTVMSEDSLDYPIRLRPSFGPAFAFTSGISLRGVSVSSIFCDYRESSLYAVSHGAVACGAFATRRSRVGMIPRPARSDNLFLKRPAASGLERAFLVRMGQWFDYTLVN